MTWTRLLASIVASLLIAATAPCQWTCVRLHPANATASQANATTGAQQGGYATIGSASHAGYWSGTAATWVDLHPSGSTSSQVLAMAAFVQVGVANQHAALWRGSAGSRVDLNPVGATASAIRGTDGIRHVGSIHVGVQDRACVWSGTSTPPYDLHSALPASAVGSYAFAVSGGEIAGYYNLTTAAHAVVWSGGTYRDLTPAGATGALAYGVEAGQQVGYAAIGGVNRACLWHGTANSWVDLHPSGQLESKAMAAFGGHQVGYTRPAFSRHAAIWNGTAASVVDLHPFAPSSMYDTFATALWSDGTTLYVAGWGNDALLAQPAALLWTLPLGANSLAANATLGQGCGTLQLQATTRPLLAGGWRLAATGAPPTTALGVTWLGLADPGIRDLAGLGLPGCSLRARLDLGLGTWLPANGGSTLDLMLPATLPSLIGLRLFVQAATFTTPPPNAFGAITSNGVVGTIGDH